MGLDEDAHLDKLRELVSTLLEVNKQGALEASDHILDFSWADRHLSDNLHQGLQNPRATKSGKHRKS
jgi:hypothetical protein